LFRGSKSSVKTISRIGAIGHRQNWRLLTRVERSRFDPRLLLRVGAQDAQSEKTMLALKQVMIVALLVLSLPWAIVVATATPAAAGWQCACGNSQPPP
jgi:hypothetical protein